MEKLNSYGEKTVKMSLQIDEHWLFQEESQLNLHWTEYICMSIASNYFALLSVTHNLNSYEITLRESNQITLKSLF